MCSRIRGATAPSQCGFGDVPASLEALRGRQFDAVAAVGDAPAVLAAEVADALGIPFHPPAAARACHDKYLARQLFQAAGLPVPQFFRVALADGPDAAARRAPYPCVLKPLGLSASRGVIRANDPDEFEAAFARIRTLLEAARMDRREAAPISAGGSLHSGARIRGGRHRHPRRARASSRYSISPIRWKGRSSKRPFT